MANRLTYKELEKQVKELKSEAVEHKHIEERLRISEERLRRLIEHSTDAFFVHDIDGRIIDTNQHACESLGYERDELLRLSISDIELDFTPENHPDKWSNMVQGVPAMFIGKHRRKDGTIFPVEIRLSIFDSGKQRYMLGIVRDISERMLAEQALKENEEKYRMLFEHSGFATSVSDLETGEIIAFNKKAYESLGYTSEEFKKLSSVDIQPHKTPEEIVKEKKRVIKIGSLVGETKHKTKNGDIRDVLMSSVPIRINDKYFIQHIYIDITKWKRMNVELQNREAELEGTNKSLEEMNSALKVLLKKRDEDRTELEEKVLLGIQELVVPYLEKLKKSALDKGQEAYVDIARSNLAEITNPFPYGLTSRHLNLTPMEIKVSNLIKQGKTSKDIADLFNLSFRTIDVHRTNIRKKLGIKSEKANLRSLLLSLQ